MKNWKIKLSGIVRYNEHLTICMLISRHSPHSQTSTSSYPIQGVPIENCGQPGSCNETWPQPKTWDVESWMFPYIGPCILYIFPIVLGTIEIPTDFIFYTGFIVISTFAP